MIRVGGVGLEATICGSSPCQTTLFVTRVLLKSGGAPQLIPISRVLFGAAQQKVADWK